MIVNSFIEQTKINKMGYIQVHNIANKHEIDVIPCGAKGREQEMLILELEDKAKQKLNRCEMRFKSIYTLKKSLLLTPSEIKKRYG